MESRTGKVCLVGIGTLLASHANAYEPAQVEVSNGLKFVPEIATDIGYNDNPANQQDDEQDSWFAIVSPKFALQGGNNITGYGVTYTLIDGSYADSDEDDFTDHVVDTRFNHEFTARHRIELNYQFARRHEERGTGLSEGRPDAFDEVVEKDNQRVDLVYGLGVREATFNVDLHLGYADVDYRNFEEVSDYRDYDSLLAGTVLYWRLAPRTSLLFEWQMDDKEYNKTAATENSRDSKDHKALVGLKWEATGKTSGEIKMGYEDRNYDADARKDFSGFTWLVGVEWQPLTYSTISLDSGRRAKDPDTLGDYIEESSVHARWRHNWSNRLATITGIEYVEESFTGIDREDEFLSSSIGLRYDWLRWLSTEVKYSYTDMDSNIDAVTYDKNVYTLTVNASL
ncbi:outer membrane beta-barrel protein [Neiella marina]|uniref:Outer membrane beta-barrel protein n=1 Tax=Neiella holothuriorum TaxID=2870530 RepID=A0ABS7EGI3_9GAMM|nr:outer membrane beta-barrel protein [Neiella holothuriorum]MBW8191448.1 outer membrane beta-barrel protein [Neiella holothuriorum]